MAKNTYRVKYNIESESSYSGSCRSGVVDVTKSSLRFDPDNDRMQLDTVVDLIWEITYNGSDRFNEEDCPPCEKMFPELNLDDENDKNSVDWDEVQWNKMLPDPDCDMAELMSDEGGKMYRTWEYYVEEEKDEYEDDGNEGDEDDEYPEMDLERTYDEELTLKIKVYDGTKRLKIEDLYTKSKGDDLSK